MEYNFKNDCWITMEEMPLNIRGICTIIDGENVIVINSLLSAKERKRAAEHEFKHIARGDLFAESFNMELEK